MTPAAIDEVTRIIGSERSSEPMTPAAPDAVWVRARDIVKGTLWARFPVINVDRVADIPCDYPGPMGVPITFLDKFNPDQFELLGRRGHLRLGNGRECYQRIFIRNLRPALPEFVDLAGWLRDMGVPVSFVPIEDAGPGVEIRPEYRARPVGRRA